MESARPLLRVIADEIEFAIKQSIPPASTIDNDIRIDICKVDIVLRRCLHEICKLFKEPDQIVLKVGLSLLENIQGQEVDIAEVVSSSQQLLFVYSVTGKKIKSKLTVEC